MEYRIVRTDELAHFGIKGQKWGVRRFQNEDRTWTEAGKERYGSGGDSDRKSSTGGASKSGRKGLTEGQKKALKTAAIVAGTAAAVGIVAYGAYGASKYVDAVKMEAFKKTVDDGSNAIKTMSENSSFWEAEAEKIGYNRSTIMEIEQKMQRKDWEDVKNTADYNSSTFRQARKTLKGQGEKTNAQLNLRGISRKGDSGRLQWEDKIKSDLVKNGVSYEELGTPGGEHSYSIYKKRSDDGIRAQGYTDRDYYKRRHRREED